MVEMNIIKELHDVKNFGHLDITNDDYILVTLINGWVMLYESYFNEDLEMDIHCYYDPETGVGIESADITDIKNYDNVPKEV